VRPYSSRGEGEKEYVGKENRPLNKGRKVTSPAKREGKKMETFTPPKKQGKISRREQDGAPLE